MTMSCSPKFYVMEAINWMFCVAAARQLPAYASAQLEALVGTLQNGQHTSDHHKCCFGPGSNGKDGLQNKQEHWMQRISSLLHAL